MRFDGLDRRGARIRRTRLPAANAQPRRLQKVQAGLKLVFQMTLMTIGLYN
jgi:hypothetical protein